MQVFLVVFSSLVSTSYMLDLNSALELYWYRTILLSVIFVKFVKLFSMLGGNCEESLCMYGWYRYALTEGRFVGILYFHTHKCWIIVSIGSGQTGHASPRAASILAHVKQQHICPVSPCTMVAVLSSDRQMRQRLWCTGRNGVIPFWNRVVTDVTVECIVPLFSFV